MEETLDEVALGVEGGFGGDFGVDLDSALSNFFITQTVFFLLRFPFGTIDECAIGEQEILFAESFGESMGFCPELVFLGFELFWCSHGDLRFMKELGGA